MATSRHSCRRWQSGSLPSASIWWLTGLSKWRRGSRLDRGESMSPRSDDLLLEITGLCIEVTGRDGKAAPILKNVDLKLRRGQILGLVGESGAGKSILGLAVMGYVRQGCRLASGRILFDGIELTAASETLKRRLRGESIAYVAQSAAASFNP